ncbi:MAG: GFA family protein [Leptolyngbyaceae cyanobacterium bins.59]|nr:GFA family protein [Leptolyngbyaceae cyanobacterium bins.59]
MAQPTTYTGGCHCGAVRFQVVVDEPEAVDCNCSICRMKGFLHLIVPADRFTLLQGSEALSTYTFNTGTAKHLFCRTCGIHSFYRPRSHPDGFDVNVRCLDGDVLAQFRVVPFDGQNWEENVHEITSS